MPGKFPVISFRSSFLVLLGYLQGHLCQHSSECLHSGISAASGGGTLNSITFSWLWGFCEAVFFCMLKIAEKTLAEICREVVHVQVGFEEEGEADCIDALQQEVEVRRLAS